MEGAVLRREAHYATPVGDRDQAVEDNAGDDRVGQATQDPRRNTVIEDHQPGQPVRRGQEEQGWHEHRDRHVLHHVHRVEVFLGDVVYRPVRRKEQQHHGGDIGTPLGACGDGNAGGQHTGPNARCPPSQADDCEHQGPDLGVGLELPGAGDGQHLGVQVHRCEHQQPVNRFARDSGRKPLTPGPELEHREDDAVDGRGEDQPRHEEPGEQHAVEPQVHEPGSHVEELDDHHHHEGRNQDRTDVHEVRRHLGGRDHRQEDGDLDVLGVGRMLVVGVRGGGFGAHCCGLPGQLVGEGTR